MKQGKLETNRSGQQFFERKGGLDFLRIIAMFMILTIHFCGWGGAINAVGRENYNFYWLFPIYFVCQMGTTIFFVLSGYFLHEVKKEKAYTLHNKVCIYSIGLYLLVMILQNSKITLSQGTGFLFPLLSNKYWFISVYFVLLLLSSLLKNGLDAISRKCFQCVILAIVFNNMFLMIANGTVFEGLLSVLVGYYLKKYDILQHWKKITSAIACGIAMFWYGVERCLVRYMEIEHTQIDAGLRGILLLIAAVFLVDFFSKIKISSKCISFVAMHVLSIYLITAHPSVSGWLYSTWLHSKQYVCKPWFVMYYLSVNIIVFILCILIDCGIEYLGHRISKIKGING